MKIYFDTYMSNNLGEKDIYTRIPMQQYLHVSSPDKKFAPPVIDHPQGKENFTADWKLESHQASIWHVNKAIQESGMARISNNKMVEII